VHDPGRMCGRQSFAGLQVHVEHLTPRSFAALLPLFGTPPRDVLHRDEELVVVLADFVDLHHVGVVQLGECLRLSEHALALFRGDAIVVQDFDGDVAAELGVVGAVDDAHAAGADLFGDLEAADLDRCRLLPEQPAGDPRPHRLAAKTSITPGN